MAQGHFDRQGRARPKLRTLSIVMAIVFAGLVGTVIGALVWTSSLLQRATAAVIRDTRSLATVNELEVAILTYNRYSNPLVVSEQPNLAARRDDLNEKIARLLHEAMGHAGGPQELAQVHEIGLRIDTYRQERETIETTGMELAEAVQAATVRLNDVLVSLQALGELNAAQVERAQARALEVDRLSNLAGAGAALLLVLALLFGFLGIRRYVLRPMLQLHATIERFRRGDATARADQQGAQEVAGIAWAFNEMADALGRQRQDQLTFLAGVAHDLRNPMSGIRIAVHTLSRKELTDRRRVRTLDLLSRQVDRLARMVDDLADAIRIQAGHLELRIEEVDLRQIAEDVVRLFAPTTPDQAIVLEKPEAPVLVQGDPVRLEQVLNNSLTNAIKFSPDGTRIDVVVESYDGDAVLSVRDRGIGLTPEELALVFVPFRRLRPEVAPGTGLGLSVVRHIVEAHRGSIEVESVPGVGSVFRVRLPLVVSASVTAPTPLVAIAGGAPAPSAAGGTEEGEG
jgi:two-component system, OmpR family, sensor histidine kinase MtrB